MGLKKKSTVGGDALYLTTSKIAVSVISLVTSMLLARFRTLDEYGTYSQIIMVTDLVSTILLLGLPNSVNYFLAKAENDSEKQKFLSVYVTLSTILTITIGICLLCALPLIVSYFDNPMIINFAYVLVMYPWASLMINSLSNVCIVYGKANRLIVYNVIYAASTLIILLVARVVGMTFTNYMMVYIATMFCFALFGLGWIRKLAGALKFLLESKIIREIFIFSIPMGLASVVGTLNAELDKLVIGHFFSTEQYAIFANAAKELPVTMLATSLTAVLLPRMVKLLKNGKASQAVELWGNAAKISFCFMCLVVGGLFVFAPDIMSLFYSEKYVTEGGIMVFRVYAIILLFRAVYWGIVLNATGKTKFVFYSSILTLLFNLIGNVLSCYIIGFVGPAISSLLVTGIMMFVQLKFTSKVVDINVTKIMPWKHIFISLLQTIGLGIVFFFVRYTFFAGYSRNITILISIGLGAIWSLIYAFINFNYVKRNWVELNAVE